MTLWKSFLAVARENALVYVHGRVAHLVKHMSLLYGSHMRVAKVQEPSLFAKIKNG